MELHCNFFINFDIFIFLYCNAIIFYRIFLLKKGIKTA